MFSYKLACKSDFVLDGNNIYKSYENKYKL